MEPRLVLFFAPVVLVLLSGRSATSDNAIVDDPQHSTEGVKLYWKWEGLRTDVIRIALREVGNPCSATVNQTYANILLDDLYSYSKPNGTIDFFLRRKSFYKRQFDEILVDAILQNVSICLYTSKKLVCDSTSNTCVHCKSLPADYDLKTRNACRFPGTGGEDAEVVALIPGELPEADRLSRPPLGEEEGACGSGWLNAEDAKQWHTTITLNDDYKKKGPFSNCSMNVEAEIAFALLDRLVRGATALETEIAEYRDWWEDRLWVFRGGKYLNLAFCRQVGSGGPFVCGKDGVCLTCAAFIVHNTTEIIAACPEESGRPEDVKTRAQNCADSKLTTTKDGSSSSSGGSESEGYGTDETSETTQSRGVGMGSSPVAIAVALSLMSNLQTL